MSLGSTVLSFYPITYGFIQDMAPLKQASEGDIQHLICNLIIAINYVL